MACKFNSEANCKFDFATDVVQGLFSDDSQSISGVLSVQCKTFAGLVNGFAAGNDIDLEQEAIGRTKGPAISL
jgi:hypothetical protein